MDEKDMQIKQLHLTIANQAEAYKDEMKTQIGYLKKKLESLEQKIDNYDELIRLHKEMGK